MLDQNYLPEPLTFVTALTLAMFLACVNYIVIWFQNRRERALLWMAVAALLCGFGLFVRAILPDPVGILLGVPSILLGIGCIWTGCRVFAGKPPHWLGLAASLVAWPVVLTSTGLLDEPRFRSALAYAVGASLLGLALREMRRKRWQPRPGHWFVTLLLVGEGIICAVWALGQAVTLFGWAEFGSDINIPFSAFTITGFNLVMSYAFVALVKENSELAHAAAAYRDALTGIGNRRRLDAELAEAVTQARRRRHAVAVIMIDIDRFKLYNDSYGHPAGDACLQAVATCLANTITHPEDEVLRYGGEEFTVLLRRADTAAAYALAERMRLAVRDLNLPHGGLPSGIVTISLGVAAMPGETATAQSLIAAADRALYRAKESGRDCAELFTQEDAAEHPLEEGRIRVSPGLSP